MKTINDYIKSNNKTFQEEPYNDLDCLVFSLLSYAKLDGIIPNKKNNYILLKDAAIKFFEKYSKKDFKNEDWLFPHSYELINLLKDSPRYKNIKLYYMINDINKDGQFSAMTIRFDNTTVVSYRGTDSSVIGWKEDFEIIYKYPISSQRKAVKYLNKSLRLRDHNVVLCGHSKGGNLAMYAYMNTLYKWKIKRVYNHDGPGFNEKVFKSKKFMKLLEKTISIVPKDSVVGMILYNPNIVSINSNGFGILEHDAYTWEVKDNKLKGAALSKKSQRLNNNLKEYLNTMSEEERIEFVKATFKVFDNLNITNILELKDISINRILSIIKELKNLPTSTKKNLIAILRLVMLGIK